MTTFLFIIAILALIGLYISEHTSFKSSKRTEIKNSSRVLSRTKTTEKIGDNTITTIEYAPISSEKISDYNSPPKQIDSIKKVGDASSLRSFWESPDKISDYDSPPKQTDSIKKVWDTASLLDLWKSLEEISDYDSPPKQTDSIKKNPSSTSLTELWGTQEKISGYDSSPKQTDSTKKNFSPTSLSELWESQEKTHIDPSTAPQFFNQNQILIWNDAISFREIPYLVHFTTLNNLESILKNGLISRSNLNNSNLQYSYNDPLRLDNRINSISLSISFPNSSLFYKWRKSSPELEWIVLKLDPNILYLKSCMFFKTNAANSNMKNQSSEFSKSYNAFKSMFENNKIHDSIFPADIQAEVLCLETIEPSYITGIVTNKLEVMASIYSIQRSQNTPSKIPVLVSSYYLGKSPNRVRELLN